MRGMCAYEERLRPSESSRTSIPSDLTMGGLANPPCLPRPDKRSTMLVLRH
jgi:hypothetical protein